ncbi:hypothetical protein [Nannocystis bainbridge]|uniref:Uncharacterized protein n=1 Tax=Nannocystis bainbridge TaxID=2995303 RepID=A0ABT5E4T7_9BACT|nr:hypothetical protein [Nannocystis bainbridge]MDC0720882.1 hypothetical protein [Nannocystis bainbridge]
MVVSTAGGDIVTEKDVAEAQLVGALVDCYRVLPDAAVYLDGQLVPEEARRAALAALSEGTAPAADRIAAPPLEPDKLKDYGEVLAQLFDDLRKGYVQSMNDLHDVFRRYREMCLDNERRFADEVAQQRALTHKSLADVDLLRRSVTTTQLLNGFASEMRPQALHQGGPTLTDYVAGLVRAVAGDKKK